MLRWACVLVVCLGVGALAKNSHETGIGSAPGSKSTSCTCGMSKKGRIVGGTQALANEYPWIVMLVVRNSYDVMCGASIINTRVAITAAHCTHDLPSYIKLSIIAGTSNVNRPGQIVHVSSWVEHEAYVSPEYDASRTVNDISLLHLATPLQFNANVGPVCMPTTKYNIENQWVKLIGWGKQGEFLPSTRTLMETDVQVLPFWTCQIGFPLKSPQTQICTKGQGTGACMGDSGGPVTYLDPETNRYTLVGLVSFGSGNCDPAVPTVMTEVTAFLPWIKSKINTLGCQKVSRRKSSNFRNIVLGG
ncbi:chymotrypsin-1 [Halyomorpha halys]|uniref:chymotrypsin-1 n=1 Tax=Halyomorpha halys TaxID=286706 RepID=UPI0006D51BA7|nr:chymotrypsin-1 [Halyomorpha halys]